MEIMKTQKLGRKTVGGGQSMDALPELVYSGRFSTCQIPPEMVPPICQIHLVAQSAAEVGNSISPSRVAKKTFFVEILV